MKFREYLNTIKSLLQKSHTKRFVIGNSSADYDSIFGSLIYAYFLTFQLGQPYLPVIDCATIDLRLRFDVNYVMEKLNIDQSKLIFSSDIDYFDKENRFCLYDHNYREKIQIDQIIDHHAFQQTKESPSLQNRIIYPAGSALSLLYYAMNPKLIEHQEPKFQQAIHGYVKNYHKKDLQQDSLIDEIIRHGVLIDSFGFDPKQSDRWTKADKFLVQSIEKNQKFDISYQGLMDLKFDQKMNLNLTLEEHLRRDYKSFNYKTLGNVQYSIVCLDPDLFLQNYGEKLIQKFQIAKYQTYMIMFIWIKTPSTSSKQALFGRQAIFSISPQLQEQKRVQIRQRIQKTFNNLKMQENISFQNWNRWTDPSATVSRKVVDKNFRIEPSPEL